MNFLNKKHIYLLHEQAIKKFGGFNGEYDYTDSKIESILAQQYPCFGYEKYKTIFEKSAILGYLFTKDHCFRDGNKRLGLYVIEVLLNINNLELTFNNEYAEILMNQIAASRYRSKAIDKYIYELSNIIQNNSKPLTKF